MEPELPVIEMKACYFAIQVREGQTERSHRLLNNVIQMLLTLSTFWHLENYSDSFSYD